MDKNDQNSKIKLTVDDIRAYDWEDVISKEEEPLCEYYTIRLHAKAQELQDIGDERGHNVFMLLASISSYRLNFDSPSEPYGSMKITVDGTRPSTPSDLSKTDLETLSSVIPTTANPEFKARIADIVWVCKKDYKSAQVAIDAYLASAQILESQDSWPPFTKRLHRALQIAAQIGKTGKYYRKVINVIELAIVKNEDSDTSFLTVKLMEYLIENKEGNPSQYSIIAEKLATRALDAKNWDLACKCWECKVNWEKRSGNTIAEKDAKIKSAETFIKRAEWFADSKPASFIGASHWQSKAVQALRSACADPAMIENNHKKLFEYQSGISSEMKTIQIAPERIEGMKDEMDKLINNSMEYVQGQPFQQAILRFAFITKPISFEAVRKRVEVQSEHFILEHLANTTAVTSSGKVTGVKPSISDDDPKVREEAFTQSVFHQATIVDWPFIVHHVIIPARCKIIEEHAIQLSDMSFIVQHSPFVPNGREGLFSRGLLAGFNGDFVMAMHLLIPQAENSIRLIMEENGVITSKLESDNTQDERDLGWLLTHPKALEIFGKDIIFNLRGFLIERFGYNLRNRMAHGFLDEAQFLSEATILVWWFVLRLCCAHFAKALKAEKETDAKVP